MKISLQATSTKIKGCLILGVFENSKIQHVPFLDKPTSDYITKIIKKTGFQAQLGQILPIYSLPNGHIEQVILIGCGKSPLTTNGFRKVLFDSIKSIETLSFKQVSTALCELPIESRSLAWKVKQCAEIVSEAFYQFELFKTTKKPKSALTDVILLISDVSLLPQCEKALKQGIGIAKGVKLARDLGNLPSNICTPTFLAEQAKELSRTHSNLSVKILEEKDMQKLNMGGLLGVSQGSAEDAKLICLEYKGGNKKQAPIALVGKGVTFDTGGISIKPADSMVGMKYDMCGAASVLGTIAAAAQLKLPINIVGVIPAVENMPGGTAYKPEDILTTMSGQTIEVISTDAEGRVILADALTYCEKYKPEVVIDIATLTGAIVIALGFHATGLVANNEALAQDLLAAGIESHDRAWQLPMWEEYQEQIKSPFADMANTGGRPAGSITAACFLSRFAQKYKWAHLDVAGTAAMMMGTSERKSTGRPVYLLMQYLINQAKKNVTH